MEEKTYYFTAECGVSCGCSIEMEFQTESLEDALEMAREQAQDEFSCFSVIQIDEDGEAIG